MSRGNGSDLSRGDESDLSDEVTEVSEPEKPNEKQFDVPREEEIRRLNNLIEHLTQVQSDNKTENEKLQGKIDFIQDKYKNIQQYVHKEFKANFAESENELNKEINDLRDKTMSLKQQKDEILGLAKKAKGELNTIQNAYEFEHEKINKNAITEYRKSIQNINKKNVELADFFERHKKKESFQRPEYKKREWGLFEALCKLVSDNLKKTNPDLFDHICNLGDADINGTGELVIPLKRKKLIFVKFYKIVTGDQTKYNDETEKTELCKLFNVRYETDEVEESVLYNEIWNFNLSTLCGVMKKRELVLPPNLSQMIRTRQTILKKNPKSAFKFREFTKLFKDELGYNPDMLQKIALLNLILGDEYFEDKEGASENGDIVLFCSPFNPYTLNL